MIDLTAFNWNRKRKAAHKLDPFGKTASGVPVKRKSAASVLASLLKGDKERDSQIDSIAHRTLREELLRDKTKAATSFVAWLQKSVQAGFTGGTPMSSHPADQERRRLLAEFVAMPIPDVISDTSGSRIPWTIGVRCLNRDTGAPLKVNVARRVQGNFREFRQRWEDAFAALCQEENIIKVFRISQGCVIEKTDGSTFQMRNFDKSQAWMKGSPFQQIRHVHRSPFTAMSSSPGQP